MSVVMTVNATDGHLQLLGEFGECCIPFTAFTTFENEPNKHAVEQTAVFDVQNGF